MNTPLGNARAEALIDYVTHTLSRSLPDLPGDWTQPAQAYRGDLISLLEQAQRTQQQLFTRIAQTVEPPHLLLLALQQHTAHTCVRVALQRFSSYQQAQQAQQRMNDLITAVVEYEPLRARYTVVELSAWNDLRVKIAQAIRQQQLILPVIKHVQLTHTLPAVVIAHRLFQDAERAGELTQQNHAEHPGFCAGRIEYLSTD